MSEPLFWFLAGGAVGLILGIVWAGFVLRYAIKEAKAGRL
jgi:hypothetical protein